MYLHLRISIFGAEPHIIIFKKSVKGLSDLHLLSTIYDPAGIAQLVEQLICNQ